MQEKFEKLFHEFTPEEVDCGDWGLHIQPFLHGEKDLPEAVMYTGFQVITAPVQMETEPIYHREMENLVFLGAVLPDVFSSWDAEIHFYMGPSLDQMEKIVITEPTLVKVPKNWWHSPLTFVRVDKPVLFQAVLFAGRPGSVKLVEGPDGNPRYEYSEAETHRLAHVDVPGAPKSVPWTVINEDNVKQYTQKGSYDPDKAPSSLTTVIRPGYKSIPYSEASTLDFPKPALTEEIRKCVLAMPKEETKWGAWCPSPQAYFRGDIYMEDATYNVGWQIFTAANDMEEPHFHQGVDEYIFFMGADPMNMFDFDAEISFEIGDDPDHMETKVITKPTVVRLPPTVWHCPIRFRKMKKPLLFQAAFMHGTWGTMVRTESKADDREWFSRKYTYLYMGDNVRFCKFNDKKRCNICGACFGDVEIKEDQD
ncbi:MAG: hypothetical protein IIY36_10205 [Lachnospiraceae bacterium]|nr:hypothetical protein [Lachnospiraceae bacterium]